LINSTRVIVPLRTTGLVASNSDENAWCASPVDASPSHPLIRTTLLTTATDFVAMR
jgi:hypothetical protein